MAKDERRDWCSGHNLHPTVSLAVNGVLHFPQRKIDKVVDRASVSAIVVKTGKEITMDTFL